MTSPPSSPSHLHVRKLSTTNEDEAKTTTACPRKPGRKLVALSGEEDIMSGGPPPVQQPKRFRNGHASFRLRMLQEQHGPAGGPPAAQSGSGFEPVRKIEFHEKTFYNAEKHKLKPQSVPTSPAASGRGESTLSPLDSALQGLVVYHVPATKTFFGNAEKP
ncbi:hypothetical protein B9Z55_024328 [Caenorhabditis nigoni]|uniref:Uncharacterized protein n=1 Tax=Caenorhabditis nigoni TaxID=1611254 RepID=A0A2G5STH3_9PELO|nr:hypothetical protein B9Z55_024328 [Caenorhabditis nigoni]